MESVDYIVWVRGNTLTMLVPLKSLTLREGGSIGV